MTISFLKRSSIFSVGTVRVLKSVTRISLGALCLFAGPMVHSGISCENEGVHLPLPLLRTDLKGLQKIYSGKVRDVYEVNSESILLVTTDRVRCSEMLITSGIPYKGIILNQLSLRWLAFLRKEMGVSHYVVTADVDEMPFEVQQHADIIRGRCMLTKKIDMLPVELTFRGYICGDALQEYYKTGKFVDTILPLGLRECDKLPRPLITASLKPVDGQPRTHLTRDRCVEILGSSRFTEMAAKTVQVYDRARMHAESKGLILADTRVEFGVDPVTKEIILMGDILNPDSSHFWEIARYNAGHRQEGLDNQAVENYVSSQKSQIRSAELPEEVVTGTLDRYFNLFIALTGEPPRI